MAPISQFYKIAIALGSLLILCLAIVRQNKFLIYFAIAAIGATVARTVFLVNIPMLEMRYLVHGVPLVETLFFMAWPILWLATPKQQSASANHSERGATHDVASAHCFRLLSLLRSAKHPIIYFLNTVRTDHEPIGGSPAPIHLDRCPEASPRARALPASRWHDCDTNDLISNA